MNKIDAQSWKADMPDFREKTKAFYNGEMSKGDYKGYSGRYGSYAQKDGKASMLRLRMPAGRVTKEKLAFIAEAIRKYNVKKHILLLVRQSSFMICSRRNCAGLWKMHWMLEL